MMPRKSVRVYFFEGLGGFLLFTAKEKAIVCLHPKPVLKTACNHLNILLAGQHWLGWW